MKANMKRRNTGQTYSHDNCLPWRFYQHANHPGRSTLLKFLSDVNDLQSGCKSAAELLVALNGCSVEGLPQSGYRPLTISAVSGCFRLFKRFLLQPLLITPAASFPFISKKEMWCRGYCTVQADKLAASLTGGNHSLGRAGYLNYELITFLKGK